MRNAVFAMAGESDIQALSRAFDIHAGETLRAIKSQQNDIGLIKAEIDKLNDGQAAFLVTGGSPSSGGRARRNNPEMAALATYARSGADKNFGDYLAAAQHVNAAMTVGSNPDGGYTVLPDMQTGIRTIEQNVTPLQTMASVIETSRSQVEILIDPTQSDAQWVGETESRPETVGPQLKKTIIPAHEIYAMPKASQSLVDDSAIDVANWLITSVGTKFAIKSGAAFLNGTGVNQPTGALTYDTEAGADFARSKWNSLQYVPTGATSPTDKQLADALIAATFALRTPYLGNAQWLMARDTARKVRQLRDQQDRPLWSVDSDGQIVNGTSDRLLGFPVRYSEDMPAPAANSLSIALADWKSAYTIVNRIGIRLLRDPFSAKPYVLFYCTRRIGGAVIDFNALKLVKWSAS